MNIITRTVAGALAWGMALLPLYGTQVLWIEGETAAEVPENLENKTANKPPASGMQALPGKAFGTEGNVTVYQVTVPEALKEAWLTLRYSRLHVMDWTAGNVKLDVTTVGGNSTVEMVIDQTGGWGTRKGQEWGTYGIKLGQLPQGKATLTFTVLKSQSDFNLDGFFISEGELPVTGKEMGECRSINISNDGYIGMQLTNPAINQNDFPGITVAYRGFSDRPLELAADLLTKDGTPVRNVFENKKITLGAATASFTVTAADLGKIKDGDYVLKLHWDKGNAVIVTHFTAMGDLLAQAADKADEYEKFVPAFAADHPVAAAKLGPDFAYAVDYIRNTLVLLKSRDGDFNANDSKHKIALSYFEKAVERTAAHFAADLNGIITQTDETVARVKAGKDPYAGRSGDLRRAFYSAFSGMLEPYRILIPESYWKAKPKSYKFLLALHGAGGDENYFPENDRGSFKKAAYELGYLVAAPKGNLRYRNGGENDLAQLVRVIQREYPNVDPLKTYCTGVSMGASGTRRMVVAFPDLFAGACIVAGGLRGGVDDGLDNFKKTPTLILHGEQDGVNKVENAYRLADELKKRGCTYEIQVYPKYGHSYNGREYLERTHAFIKTLK